MATVAPGGASDACSADAESANGNSILAATGACKGHSFAGVLEASCFQSLCGACLLEIEYGQGADEVLAILDCCKPKHIFHVGCIATWAARENSCPQCKQRFAQFATYGNDHKLLRVEDVEERVQKCPFTEEEEEAALAEAEAELFLETGRCLICQSADDEAALLLCDGCDGHCNAMCHYYCLGLDGVPEGDWFCPDCRFPFDAAETEADSRTGLETEVPSGVGVQGETEAEPEPQESGSQELHETHEPPEQPVRGRRRQRSGSSRSGSSRSNDSSWSPPESKQSKHADNHDASPLSKDTGAEVSHSPSGTEIHGVPEENITSPGAGDGDEQEERWKRRLRNRSRRLIRSNTVNTDEACNEADGDNAHENFEADQQPRISSSNSDGPASSSRKRWRCSLGKTSAQDGLQVDAERGDETVCPSADQAPVSNSASSSRSSRDGSADDAEQTRGASAGESDRRRTDRRTDAAPIDAPVARTRTLRRIRSPETSSDSHENGGDGRKDEDFQPSRPKRKRVEEEVPPRQRPQRLRRLVTSASAATDVQVGTDVLQRLRAEDGVRDESFDESKRNQDEREDEQVEGENEDRQHVPASEVPNSPNVSDALEDGRMCTRQPLPQKRKRIEITSKKKKDCRAGASDDMADHPLQMAADFEGDTAVQSEPQRPRPKKKKRTAASPPAEPESVPDLPAAPERQKEDVVDANSAVSHPPRGRVRKGRRRRDDVNRPLGGENEPAPEISADTQPCRATHRKAAEVPSADSTAVPESSPQETGESRDTNSDSAAVTAQIDDMPAPCRRRLRRVTAPAQTSARATADDAENAWAASGKSRARRKPKANSPPDVVSGKLFVKRKTVERKVGKCASSKVGGSAVKPRTKLKAAKGEDSSSAVSDTSSSSSSSSSSSLSSSISLAFSEPTDADEPAAPSSSSSSSGVPMKSVPPSVSELADEEEHDVIPPMPEVPATTSPGVSDLESAMLVPTEIGNSTKEPQFLDVALSLPPLRIRFPPVQLPPVRPKCQLTEQPQPLFDDRVVVAQENQKMECLLAASSAAPSLAMTSVPTPSPGALSPSLQPKASPSMAPPMLSAPLATKSVRQGRTCSVGHDNLDGTVRTALSYLEELVTCRLKTTRDRTFRQLYRNMDRQEAQLRLECLKDRVCQSARAKYLPVFKQDPNVWATHLQSRSGKAHMERFVDKKVAEVSSRWVKLGGR